MIERLQPHELELKGNWIMENGRVRGDDVCSRIEQLVASHLKKLGVAAGGWETLFQDPDDGRYWEQTFPYGEMQGGGPPRISIISEEQAKAKYKL